MRLSNLDQVMVIDNTVDEVSWVIEGFNRRGISTTFIKSPKESGVVFNRNTKLVILDLYLGNAEDNHDDALDVAMKLSDEIHGPYIVVIWSKNDIDKFMQDLNQSVIAKYPNKNYPVIVTRVDEKKYNKGTKESSFFTHIETVVSKALDKNNIESLFDFVFVNSNNMGEIWRFITSNIDNKELSVDKYSKELNKIIGALFQSTDGAFGYDNSGKGLSRFRQSLIEESLSNNPIKYTNNHDLSDDLRLKVNGLLVFHKNNESISSYHRPGMLIADDYNAGAPTTHIYGNFLPSEWETKTEVNDSEWTYKKNGNSWIKFYIDVRYLVITPDCDYANNKAKNTLLLRCALIDVIEDTQNTSFFKNITKCLGLFHDQLNEKKHILINTRDYCTIPSNTETIKSKVKDQYLNKEYVDKVRQLVASDLSRIGISSLPRIKKEETDV